MAQHQNPPSRFPDLLLCPVLGGEFLMGDNDSSESDEKPAHRVRVSSFYMGKFQVTQRLWQEVTGANPSNFKGDPAIGGAGKRPVENVSWDDAQGFLEKLNARQDARDFIRSLDPPPPAPKGEFRLPTEAEWEYAARGGRYSQDYIFSGSDKLKQVGWHGENSGSETHDAGLLLPNELGICDMSGNVWEWCQDWFGADFYEKCHRLGVVENPQGPAEAATRVRRGGGIFRDPLFCRPAFRDRSSPGYRYDSLGFRLVLPFQSVG